MIQILYIRDACLKALDSAPGFHQSRREFLKSTLKQSQAMSQDSHYHGSKLSILLTALSMARREIDWYLHHVHRSLDGTYAMKGKGVWGQDGSILELLSLVEELTTNLKEQQKSEFEVSYFPLPFPLPCLKKNYYSIDHCLSRYSKGNS